MITVFISLLVLVLLTVGGLVAFSAFIAKRVETAIPPVGRFIEIDGARVHYLDVGTGDPIVLVHGLAGQIQHLTYSLTEALKGRYRLIFVDRPGAGYSERATGASARLPTQAATVAALIRTLGLDKPLLVGHSLGGAVALATALDHSDVVGGLALIAPLTHPQPTPPKALEGLAIASPTMRRLVSMTLATPVSMRTGRDKLIDIFGPNPVPLDFGTRGAALLGLRPKAFYAASSDLVAVNEDLPSMVGRYPSLRIPIGVLYGINDRILSPAVQGEPMVAAVPGLTLEMIDGQGHMLPITAVDRTAAFLSGMMEKVRAGGQGRTE